MGERNGREKGGGTKTGGDGPKWGGPGVPPWNPPPPWLIPPEWPPRLLWTRTKKTSWSANAAAFTAGWDSDATEANGPKRRVTTPSGKMAETDAPAESPNAAVDAPPQRGWLPVLRTVTATGKKASSTPIAGLFQ